MGGNNFLVWKHIALIHIHVGHLLFLNYHQLHLSVSISYSQQWQRLTAVFIFNPVLELMLQLLSFRSKNFAPSVLAPLMAMPCPAAELTQGSLTQGDTEPHKQLSLHLPTDGKRCSCTHHTSMNSQHIKDCHLRHRQVNCILEYICSMFLCFHPFFW